MAVTASASWALPTRPATLCLWKPAVNTQQNGYTGASGSKIPVRNHHHDVRDLLTDIARSHQPLLSIPNGTFIVLGGFPCQDLSGANPQATGFKGRRSIKPVVMAVVIRRLQDLAGTSRVAFAAEMSNPRFQYGKP